MTESKYNKIARLLVYLFENTDADVVEVGDPPIKITRNKFDNIIGKELASQNPNIQIINNIVTNIQVDNKTIINNILNQLENEGKETEELQEVRKRLNELNKEFKKKKPKWNKIKKIIIWALEYSKDFFVQLLPLLLKNSAQ